MTTNIDDAEILGHGFAEEVLSVPLLAVSRALSQDSPRTRAGLTQDSHSSNPGLTQDSHWTPS